MVIQMMAKLVKERAQERAEGNDATVLDRAHPEGNDGGRPAFGQLIQSVQFSPSAGRPHGQDPKAKQRNTEIAGQARCQFSADLFCLHPVFLLQCRSQAGDKREERLATRQGYRVDLITFTIDALLGCG